MAGDPDPNDQVFFEAYGEPFILQNPPTFFTEPTIHGNEIETFIAWTPSAAEVRPEPYLVVLRLMDGTYMYDESILPKLTVLLILKKVNLKLTSHYFLIQRMK